MTIFPVREYCGRGKLGEEVQDCFGGLTGEVIIRHPVRRSAGHWVDGVRVQGMAI